MTPSATTGEPMISPCASAGASTLFWVNAAGSVYVDQVSLPNGATATKTYLGRSTADSGSGILSGGSNAFNVQVALDRSNTAGVTNSSAANAATATKGFEFYIPFGALNLNPASCAKIRLMAAIVQSDGTFGNQILPPLSAGSPAAGTDPNFSSLSGTQFATFTLLNKADLNADTFVDDDDFVLFATAYNILSCADAAMPADCPSDLNSDSFVDDGDFVLFVAAYNALVCP